MEQVNSPWGFLPRGWRLSTIDEEKERLTDYVANGSFASLASNVHYKDTEDYAVLIRLVDFNNDFKGPFVYIDEHAYSFLSKSSLSGGEIIISNVGANVGTVFKCPNLPYKMSLAPNAITIKLKGDNDFYYYWFKSKIGQANIQALVTGSAQPKFNKTNFRSMYIPVPPLDVQRRIASILSSLDRKIELNNKINADLEEMAQAIFKNWFVDFEPFKDGKFVDSELGMIPEGWKVISLNEILDNVSGYSYKGSELQSSNIAMATIKNFERKGGFKTEGYKEIVISKKIKETQFVNMFDVLVAHTDLTQNAEIVGNPAIVLSKGGYEKLIMSMDLTKVISKIDGVTNGLLYCILSTSRFKEHALGYVNGTTVLHMSKKAVPEYTCAFPKDINQIRDLCITLDSIYKRMAVTYDENSRLSTLRDTLLPRLMSGEIEVLE